MCVISNILVKSPAFASFSGLLLELYKISMDWMEWVRTNNYKCAVFTHHLDNCYYGTWWITQRFDLSLSLTGPFWCSWLSIICSELIFIFKSLIEVTRGQLRSFPIPISTISSLLYFSNFIIVTAFDSSLRNWEKSNETIKEWTWNETLWK